MHEIAKWGKRAGRMQKRRRRLFSPASLSILPQRVSIPLPQGEDEFSSSKQGKESTKHKHKAWAYSIKPRGVMAESKGRESIAPKNPRVQDAKPMSSKGKRYKGKYRLSQKMIFEYLKESRCFRCGGYRYVSCTCIPKKQRKTLTTILVREDTFTRFKLPCSGSLFST